MSLLATAVLALAEVPPADIDPTTGKGAEFGKAAPVGLLVILLMCVATFFLLRSMNRNMRKVPKTFDSISDPRHPDGTGPVEVDPVEADGFRADGLKAVAVEDGSASVEPIGERTPRPPA